MQRAMSSSSPRIGSHFASCDDVLAAVRSATFLCEGSDVPIHAEYTSRKTGNGKKITVRCKLGVRKPGRKRAGERIKGEDEYCPFRLVACRETASTGPPSSNFVVTEFDAHTAWAHECESRIDADVGESMKTETSPSFVPDSPVIIDSQLVTSTGFSIPLLPLTRQTQGGRTRPKKRPVGNCEHRGDAMWRKWEQRVLLGDAVRVAKRPRLRGTGGEDALQAWGWVANLAVEEPELEQLPPSAATANVGTQIDEGCGVAESTTTLPRATERADAALPPHEAGESRDDAAQPQLQHLVAFLKRPTVIRFEPAPVIWRKLTPLPVTPFTPPPPPPCADAGQDERFISPTSTESPAASTHTVESRHETPETSYSPISLSLYRQLAPIQRAPLVQLDKATTPCLSAPADSVDQGAPSHKQEQDALREQVALEALLGLQQLTFHPQSDTAKSQASPPPPPPAPSVSQPLFSSAPIRSSDAQHGTVNEQQTPPLPPRDRKQRKLSRWERPEVAEDDEAKSESGLPSPAANVEEGASSAPSTESPDAATAPTASPPKPAALAFIPRTSKKSAAMRRAPATPLRSTSLSTGGSSTAFSSSRLGMAQNLTSASKMAIAQASKIKRDADLREELRSKSAAPPPTLSGDDEETEAEARVRKAAEQAEGLKQLLWKVGGEREGGKIDRLYSARGLRDKLSQLERIVPGFRAPEALSKPNAEVYISLLAGVNRPARHRLPSLPTFPRRPPTISPLFVEQGHGSDAAQPDKRQLLALEYLYGRAVGPDECAYLREKEPAMWELVKVAAAVAEVNERSRRISRDHGPPQRASAAGTFAPGSPFLRDGDAGFGGRFRAQSSF